LRTLYIGETNKEDTEYYYTLDKSAFNLDNKNYEKGLQEKKSGVFYTSLSDFQYKYGLLYEVCLSVDQIIYNPPLAWKENNFADYITSSSKDISDRICTECFLICLRDVTKVNGLENIFNIKSFYPIVNRQTDSPNLWIAGCSFSSADGVDDDERWGQIVAKQLNMPTNFLAESGSGNLYQVSKILSSDIRKDDIVILQITSPERYTIIHKEKLLRVNAYSYQIFPELINMFPPNRLDEPINYVEQIENFKILENICKKIGAKLMVWSQHMMPGILLSYLIKQDHYFHFTNAKYTLSTEFMLDYGTDNMHPGPLQHQEYAKFVLEKLKLLEEQ